MAAVIFTTVTPFPFPPQFRLIELKDASEFSPIIISWVVIFENVVNTYDFS